MTTPDAKPHKVGVRHEFNTILVNIDHGRVNRVTAKEPVCSRWNWTASVTESPLCIACNIIVNFRVHPIAQYRLLFSFAPNLLQMRTKTADNIYARLHYEWHHTCSFVARGWYIFSKLFISSALSSRYTAPINEQDLAREAPDDQVGGTHRQVHASSPGSYT